MIGLTQRQLDTLRFIAGYQQAKGRSPSYAEIADGIGVRQRSAVFKILRSLKERNALTAPAHRPRAIELTAPVAIPRTPDGTPL